MSYLAILVEGFHFAMRFTSVLLHRSPKRFLYREREREREAGREKEREGRKAIFSGDQSGCGSKYRSPILRKWTWSASLSANTNVTSQKRERTRACTTRTDMPANEQVGRKVCTSTIVSTLLAFLYLYVNCKKMEELGKSVWIIMPQLSGKHFNSLTNSVLFYSSNLNEYQQGLADFSTSSWRSGDGCGEQTMVHTVS